MKTILTTILVSLATGMFGQTWIKTYDHKNGNTDVASKIIETHNQHFIVAGHTTIPANYLWGFNGYIMALDFNGDTLWTKETGSTANDFLNDVIENNNNELIFTGMRYYINAFTGDNSQQLWILKIQLNSNGTQITNMSEKYFGGKTNKDGGNKIIQNSDGTYFVTGVTESYGTQQGGEDAWLLKLNSNLDTLWTKTYDFGYKETAKSIIPFNSNNYLLIINSTTGQIGFPPYYTSFSKVLLIDSLGSVLKTLTFNNDTISFISNARPTSDGGAILIGSSGLYDNSSSGGGRNIFVIKLDPNADTTWTKIYGAYGKYDGGFDIIQDNDGTYYAACYTQTQYTDSVDNWYLMHLDQQGNLLNSSCLIHKKDNDDPLSILKVSDGTIIVAGHINANSNPLQGLNLGNSDICIAKLNTDFTTSVSKHIPGRKYFRIFPNPFNDNISFQFKSDEFLELELVLFDYTSRKLIQKKFTKEVTLSTEQLSKGIYIYEIKNKDIVIDRGKIIKE
ncbi:MAG: T9SS type A sorting domain-containing protein [Flavobacterium piscis]|nr:T9SS type A sorting domain-containing protein [Flavobacterium piscis]